MSVSLTDRSENNDNTSPQDQYYHYDQFSTINNGISEIEEDHDNGICEIEEDHEHHSSNGDAPPIKMARLTPMPSIKEEHDKSSVLSTAEDSVYVAVGKSASSVDALDWALKNAVNSPSTIVYLIHIYPETKQIPTPLGKLPLSQVSPEQVKTYMAQERGKRRELLQKFLYRCSAVNVNVDTILIESDTLPKAILDLMDILHIRKLVIGTTKSSLRKLRSRKGTGTADQILKSAPEHCELKIICEGNEVIIIDQVSLESPSQHSNRDNSNFMTEEKDHNDDDDDDDNKPNEAISCICFKSK